MADSLVSAGSDSQSASDRPTLAALRGAYARADRAAREVQSFTEAAGIPAINELRYAGFHLLGALNDVGAVIDEAELTRAINHAHRACYEAAEAGILFALDAISRFKTDYEFISVSSVVPDYADILSQAEDAKDGLAEPRELGSERTADHARLMAVFTELRRHSRRLEASRVELNKLREKERREGRRFVIGTIIALLTLVAAIAGTVVGFAALHLAPS